MTTGIDRIREALKSPRIKDAKYSDLANYLAKVIGIVFAIRSTEIDPDNIQYMARELARSVWERFPGISVAELGIALDKGVKRDYGDYFGLNVVTFLDWVRAYFYSTERKIAVSEKNQLALPPKTVPTEKEFEELRRKNTISMFELYKHYGVLIGDPSYPFAYLESRGTLKLTREEKLSIFEEAKKIASKNYMPAKDLTGRDDNKRLNKAAQVCRSLDTAFGVILRDRLGYDLDKIAVIEAKRISIARFFDRLIAERKSIADLLK